jgi:hypothetical protein
MPRIADKLGSPSDVLQTPCQLWVALRLIPTTRGTEKVLQFLEDLVWSRVNQRRSLRGSDRLMIFPPRIRTWKSFDRFWPLTVKK